MTEEAYGLRVVREGDSLIAQWRVAEKNRRKATGVLPTETTEKRDKAEDEDDRAGDSKEAGLQRLPQARGHIR